MAPIDMQREWRAMQRRLVDHVREPRTSDLSGEPTRVPASFYTDPVRFAAERDRVFREQPLLAGFSGDVPAPGDRMLFDEAGPPILIVRDMEGDVRAFLNLCPHRGARVAEDCERARMITCPFHGWSFGLDGRLAGMPLPSAFEGMDREEVELVALPAAEWKGMIFVRAQPGPPIDVPAFLGPIAELVEALELDRLEPIRADLFEEATNWKIALDTFCETYHVPALHRESLNQNLISYVAIFDHYGQHHRYSGPGEDFLALVDQPESAWPEDGYQAVHYLFPNTTFAYTHAFDGRTPVVSMFRVFPGEDVGRAVTLGSTYRRSDAPDPSDETISEMHDIVLDIVRNEDYRVARQSWRSLLHAPADFALTTGRTEPILRHYHRDLAKASGLPLP